MPASKNKRKGSVTALSGSSDAECEDKGFCQASFESDDIAEFSDSSIDDSDDDELYSESSPPSSDSEKEFERKEKGAIKRKKKERDDRIRQLRSHAKIVRDENSDMEMAEEQLSKTNQIDSNEAGDSLFKKHLKNVIVPVYRKINGKRAYSKAEYCLYCKRMVQSKMTVHLLRMHRDQEDIKRALQGGKTSARKEILYAISCLGNYKHNIQVFTKGEGELVVLRRPIQETPAWQFIPCNYCYGFILHSTLSQHAISCTLNKTRTVSDAARAGKTLLAPYIPISSSTIIRIFHDLKPSGKCSEEDIKAVKEDPLVKAFAAAKIVHLNPGNAQASSEFRSLRNDLRIIARLFADIRAASQTEYDMDTCLSAKYFKIILRCAKDISRKNIQMAITIGHHLRSLVLLKISIAIQNDDQTTGREAEGFKFLLETHWAAEVGRAARREQTLYKIRRVKELPLMRDLVKLEEYLRESMRLEQNFFKLSKLCLAQLIIFNKRQPQKVAELLTEDFKRDQQFNHFNEELFDHLDATERVLARRMSVVEVGRDSTKAKRKTLLLIPEYVKTEMQRLLYVPGIFMFPKPKALKAMEASRVISEALKCCKGLEHPTRMNHPALKNYTATMCQILAMNEQEINMMISHINDFTNFDVDLETQESSASALPKMANLLCAIEKGNVDDRESSLHTEAENADLEMMPELKVKESGDMDKAKELDETSSDFLVDVDFYQNITTGAAYIPFVAKAKKSLRKKKNTGNASLTSTSLRAYSAEFVSSGKSSAEAISSPQTFSSSSSEPDIPKCVECKFDDILYANLSPLFGVDGSKECIHSK